MTIYGRCRICGGHVRWIPETTMISGNGPFRRPVKHRGHWRHAVAPDDGHAGELATLADLAELERTQSLTDKGE